MYPDRKGDSFDIMVDIALTCVRDNHWYDLFAIQGEEGFLPEEFDIIRDMNSSECLDYLLEENNRKQAEYQSLRNESSIYDWYKRISSLGATDEEDQFIHDFVKYEIIGNSSSHKKWFKYLFDREQPVFVHLPQHRRPPLASHQLFQAHT